MAHSFCRKDLTTMRSLFARISLGSILVVGASMLLSSPAGATTSARSLVQQAIAASESASSVTVVGSVLSGSDTVTMNVSASSTGDGQGKIGIDNGTAIVRSVNSEVYFMGDSNFWVNEGGDETVNQAFAGKWVKTKATSKEGKDLEAFLNSKTFMKSTFSGGVGNAQFVIAGHSMVLGQPVTIVTSTNGQATGQLEIAAKGRPYLVQISSTGDEGGSGGSLLFIHYNQPVHPAAPKGAIDLDKLQS
jgi:hypothetical protein